MPQLKNNKEKLNNGKNYLKSINYEDVDQQFDKKIERSFSEKRIGSIINDGLAAISQFDVSFPPGLGQYPEDHPLTINNRTFSIQWLNKKGLQPDKLVLVRVQGDSYGTIT